MEFVGRKTFKEMIGLVALLVVLCLPSTAGASEPQNLRTCGERPFSLSVFDKPAGFEKGKNGLARALRGVIRIKWLAFPKHGWRLLFKGERFAQVISGDLDSDYLEAITFRFHDGKWGFWRSGGCDLEAYRPGFIIGVWDRTLGEDYNRETTRLRVDVYEMACNSGRPPLGRVTQPEIRYLEDKIIVTYFVKPNRGAHTCPGAPPVTKVLKLEEPIGDRSIVDGSTFPYPERVSAPGPTGFFDSAVLYWGSPSCYRPRGRICVSQEGPSRIREGEAASFRVRIRARTRLTGVRVKARTSVTGELKRSIGSIPARTGRKFTFRVRCPKIEGEEPVGLNTSLKVTYTTHRGSKPGTFVTGPAAQITCVPQG